MSGGKYFSNFLARFLSQEAIMLFSSNIFIYCFLPALIIVYYCAPRAIRNLILLAFSFVFYVWGGGSAIVLLVAVIVFDYFAGLLLFRSPARFKKLFLLLAVL